MCICEALMRLKASILWVIGPMFGRLGPLGVHAIKNQGRSPGALARLGPGGHVASMELCGPRRPYRPRGASAAPCAQPTGGEGQDACCRQLRMLSHAWGWRQQCQPSILTLCGDAWVPAGDLSVTLAFFHPCVVAHKRAAVVMMRRECSFLVRRATLIGPVDRRSSAMNHADARTCLVAKFPESTHPPETGANVPGGRACQPRSVFGPASQSVAARFDHIGAPAAYFPSGGERQRQWQHGRCRHLRAPSWAVDD